MERRRYQRTKVRELEIDGPIARVPLTRGFFAMIDAADVPIVQGWNWGASHHSTPYASRNRLLGGKQKPVFMHRQIMEPPPGFVVDHINGDTLDNRRANLRICTQRANMQNRSNTRRELFWQPAQIAPPADARPLLLGRLRDGEWEYEVRDTLDVSGFTHWRMIERPPT